MQAMNNDYSLLQGVTDEQWKVITILIGGRDICDIRKSGPLVYLAMSITIR